MDERLPKIIISTENNEGKSGQLTDIQTDSERKTEKEEKEEKQEAETTILEENANNLAELKKKEEEMRIAEEAKIAEDKANELAELKEKEAENEKKKFEKDTKEAKLAVAKAKDLVELKKKEEASIKKVANSEKVEANTNKLEKAGDVQVGSWGDEEMKKRIHVTAKGWELRASG